MVSMKERIKRELWFYSHVQKIPKKQLYQIIDYRLQEFEEQLIEVIEQQLTINHNN